MRGNTPQRSPQPIRPRHLVLPGGFPAEMKERLPHPERHEAMRVFVCLCICKKKGMALGFCTVENTCEQMRPFAQNLEYLVIHFDGSMLHTSYHDYDEVMRQDTAKH